MAIDNNPFTGAPLYLRDSQWANKFFGGTSMLNQPKRKFTFVAGFIPNSEAVADNQLYREMVQDNVFLVKTFDPPRLEFDSEVVDQYNKKRIIQRRVNYSPVSIRFHDDVDNKIFNLIVSYFKYYYGDAFNVDISDWRLDTISEFVKQGGWGFRAPIQKYFFNSIYIAWVNNASVTYVNLRNPMITDISFDTLDYADGSTPLEISLTLNYEGFVPRSINAPITATGDTIAFVRSLLQTTEDIGQPFTGPNPGQAVPGRDRSPGLGELVNAGFTFFGKHNNKPTPQDFLDDFVVRPILGTTSGALNSWGNFNFGGIGTAKSSEGLAGRVGSVVGDPFKFVNSGSVVTEGFRFGANALGIGGSTGGNSNLSDPEVNDRFADTLGTET